MGNMDVYNPGITYRFYKKPVDIPFGFGLSYTTFHYSALSLSATYLDPCSLISVFVNITNTGIGHPA